MCCSLVSINKGGNYGSDGFVGSISPHARQSMGAVCNGPAAGFSQRCPEGPSRGRREETLWPAERSSRTAALTHLPDVVRRLGPEKRAVGSTGAPTDSYFTLDFCLPLWLSAGRLSLNMAVMWRAVCSGRTQQSSALGRLEYTAALNRHSPELRCKLRREVQATGVWLSTNSQPKLINGAESLVSALDCHFKTLSPSIFISPAAPYCRATSAASPP